MVLYEIYREDGGNGITFVHMLYNKSVQMYLLHLRLIKQKIVWRGGGGLEGTSYYINIWEVGML